MISILVGILPTSALAAIGATKNNTLEQNEEILDRLNGICGNDAEALAMFEKMDGMGILDENGGLVSGGLNVDGKTMTLDELRELENSKGVDLGKVVLVDGTSLTLKNLKVMIEIEDEIQRVKDTYCNDDVTLNKDQISALASLRAQFKNEEIELFSSSPLASVEVPSGIDHTIRAQIDTTPVTYENGDGTQSVAVTLQDGSGISGTNYSGTSGTLVFPAGSNETTKHISFSINNDTSRFNGQKAFLIQFYDPQNIVLTVKKSETEKENMLTSEKIIKINNSYTWPTMEVTESGNERSLRVYNNYTGTYCTETHYCITDEFMSLLMENGVFNTIDFQFSCISAPAATGEYTAYATVGNEHEYLYNYSDKVTDDFDEIHFSVGNLVSGKRVKMTTDASFVFHPEKMYQTFPSHKVGYPTQNGGCFIIQSSDSGNSDKTIDVGFNIRFYDTKAPTIKSVSGIGGNLY